MILYIKVHRTNKLTNRKEKDTSTQNMVIVGKNYQ